MNSLLFLVMTFINIIIHSMLGTLLHKMTNQIIPFSPNAVYTICMSSCFWVHFKNKIYENFLKLIATAA